MHLIRFPTAGLTCLLPPAEQAIQLAGAESRKDRSTGLALLKLKKVQGIADPEKLQQQGHGAPPGGGSEPKGLLERGRIFRYRNSNQPSHRNRYRSGQLLQQGFGCGQVDAGIGDALAVGELAEIGGQLLITSHDVALEHHPQN